MNDNFLLRKVVLEDADLILEWRNDITTRKNSKNMDFISADTHYDWMRKVLASDDLFYIFQVCSVPVGVIRLAIADGVGTISYNIAPNKRGCGYGKRIVQLLENYLVEIGVCTRLRAEVKKDNIASQKIFLGQNFIEHECLDKYVYEKEKATYQQINAKHIFGGVILLTNNRNALVLYDWLKSYIDCLLYSEYIDMDILNNYKPRLIISYNYAHIINEDVIEYMRGQCINLHISMLPWNRGSDPNFWSFIDDTPKGVTIHRVAKGLDTGDIIYQENVHLCEEKETFASSYRILQQSIVELLKKHFKTLLSGNYAVTKQIGNGTYHRRRDFEKLISSHDFDWNMNIKAFKKRLHNLSVYSR